MFEYLTLKAGSNHLPMRKGPAQLAKPVLAGSDFTYQGGFRVPAAITPTGTSTYTSVAYMAAGLSHRYVAGQLRLISASTIYNGGQVYEMSVPALSDPVDLTNFAGYPRATLVRSWGDVFGGKRWILDPGLNTAYASPTYPIDSNTGHNVGNLLWSLFWDPVDSRLYWTYGVWYDGNSTRQNGNPCVGYTTFVDTPGSESATAFGPWRVSGVGGVNSFRHRGAACRIPAWFADAYCGGKKLGVGGGGIYANTSPASFGPVITAVSDPSLTAVADIADPTVQTSGILTGTPVLDYEGNTATTGDPTPCLRDGDYDGATFDLAAGGTSGAAYLALANGGFTFGRWYTPGYAHATSYVPGPVTLTFSDLTTQTRNAASYALDGSNNWVLTFDAPLSGGKVVDSATTVSVHQGPPGTAVYRDPSGGVGSWTEVDYVQSGMAWIDGTNKHGLVYLPYFGSGRVAYVPGGTQVEFSHNDLFVYGPSDLALAAQGSVVRSHVAPNRYAWTVPGIPNPRTSPFGETPGSIATVAGVTFDATTNTLYVLTKGAYNDGAVEPMVHVYSVNC